MWLLLRAEATPETLLQALRAESLEVRVHRLGDRWALEIQGNGHLSEAFARYEEVERVFSTHDIQPLVQQWSHNVELPTWQRGKGLLWIAGPCSVERKADFLRLAQELRAIGVQVLRGGAFKARTSPYSFQGMGQEALDWLFEAKSLTGLPICVEVVSETHLPLYEHVDILQIGARNMDDYWLLKAVAPLGKPVLLKRNPQATIEEWLLAAEYLLLYGTPWVLLCERGIRTFERSLRYTMDIGAIPAVQRKTRLPVIADPSHAAGRWDFVEPLALAAIGAGSEGLIVEVHPEPLKALSDAAQQLTIEQFQRLYERANAIYTVLSRHLSEPLQA
ncbi:MAG: 3-deoxy-7-phosphoheptulonate synthase [Bacteroidia bacterium]|nr:3-deoxy-7-phosphoheptulonate synthase [Bacteroidia bacterium]MCX7652747.1 3-deoxy-7-phosphoheptulonate synthase [Bacteroidia bacterium]MDW8417285.1 3-deoxy-7-phosphoheptulonate synthase [Bacteroidia bacterium]